MKINVQPSTSFHRLFIRRLFFLLFITAPAIQASAQSGIYRLLSPDHQLAIVITTGEEVSWSVLNNNTQILLPSKIALELANGEVLGRHAVVRKSSKINVDKTFSTAFYKKSSVTDQYAELTLNFSGNYSLVFRAYNDGVAYRFITRRKGELTIKNETASLLVLPIMSLNKLNDSNL